MSSHELFNKIFDNMGRAVLEKVKAAASAQMPSLVLDFADAQVQSITRAKQVSAEEENTHLLDAIWHKFDADNNGQLDADECKLLAIEFLTAARDRLPEVLIATMGEMVKLQVAAMTTAMRGLLGDDASAAELDAALGPMMAQISADSELTIKSMAHEVGMHIGDCLTEAAIESLSNEMHSALDANGDNIIVKEEFMTHFFQWLVAMRLIPSELPMGLIQGAF
eukprot:Amastigsp_a5553_32.p3 type:complete len:223 gc:universal Amastigsp_a5553_32:2889-2221(-)